MIDCKLHGSQPYYEFKDKAYKSGIRRRCKQCVKDAVIRRMAKVKKTLVAEAGGKCISCGYSRCIRNLHFHHCNRTEKEFTISGGSKSLERLRTEVKKCVLLCSNCHGEVEEGILMLQ